MERVMNMAVLILSYVIFCVSHPLGIEKELEVTNNGTQTIDPNNDLFKYIQPADESLKSDPNFAATILMVFKTNSKEDTTDLQNKSGKDEIVTQFRNDTSNNTGIGERHLGRRTVQELHRQFVHTTENINDIRLESRATHPHPGVDQHTSETTTKTQDQTTLDISGTQQQQPNDLAENKYNDVNRIGTEHHTTPTSIPKQQANSMDNNAANATKTNIYVYFMYSIFIILLSRLN